MNMQISNNPHSSSINKKNQPAKRNPANNPGAFFCPQPGKKTGLSAPIPRKAPMRFPAGFPLQSLAPPSA
jgi:hypothetical protein